MNTLRVNIIIKLIIYIKYILYAESVKKQKRKQVIDMVYQVSH